MKKLFGTDGIRRFANEFIENGLAEKVGTALGIILKRQKSSSRAVVGGDTRSSYNAIAEALCRGLSLSGINVTLAGTVPTPAIAYFTANYDFDAGIMISASHNSHEYNGIKIFSAGGFKLSDDLELEIEKIIASGETTVPDTYRGNISADEELKKSYISYLKNYIPNDKTELFAVIDCANGSAYATAKEVFSFLSDKTVFIGTEPNGLNINDGCGSTNVNFLSKKVVELGADIGLAFDGDADRLLATDRYGNIVDGDNILAILADSLREKCRLNKNAIVGTVASNYGLSIFAKENGYEFIETSVGDKFVLEKIESERYSLGGEQSGHTIIREAATTGDGQLTALYLISRMAETSLPLDSLASGIKKLPQYSANIPATDTEKIMISNNPEICRAIDKAKRILGNGGRVLVRPSGTEPLIRISLESVDKEAAKLALALLKREIKVALKGI